MKEQPPVALMSLSSIIVMLCPSFYFSSTWWDFFLPVTVYKWIWTREFPHQHPMMLFLAMNLAWVGPMTLGFYCWEMFLICTGYTPHEWGKSKCYDNV